MRIQSSPVSRRAPRRKGPAQVPTQDEGAHTLAAGERSFLSKAARSVGGVCWGTMAGFIGGAVGTEAPGAAYAMGAIGFLGGSAVSGDSTVADVAAGTGVALIGFGAMGHIASAVGRPEFGVCGAALVGAVGGYLLAQD